MAPQLNTNQVKIAWFDDDEDDKQVFDMSIKSKNNLLQALDHAIFRAKSRNTNVKMYVVLAPCIKLEDNIASDFAFRAQKIKDCKLLSTDADLMILLTAEEHLIHIKFVGGYTFLFPQDQDLSAASDDSAFQELNGNGLTQECNLGN